MLSPDKGKSSCKGNYQMKCFLNIPIDRCPLCSVLCKSKSAVLLCATNTARTHARIHISNSVARIRQLFKVTLRKHCALLHLINLLRQFLAYLKKIFNMSFHVQLVTVFVLLRRGSDPTERAHNILFLACCRYRGFMNVTFDIKPSKIWRLSGVPSCE